MEPGRPNIIIAALSFTNRLGIKTLLGIVAPEPDITEVINYEQLISQLKLPNTFSHLILDEEILPSPGKIHFEKIRDYSPDLRILILCSKNPESCPGSMSLLYHEGSSRVLEVFGDLFSEPKPNDQQDGDTVVLSEREMDVLKQVALGFSNKEIADTLYISVNTVITHRKNITDKLGIKTIAGLTVYAIMNNLISPDEVRS
jgi:DNA-binding CsgD family transcriptional regulator